ncbi:adenylate kinase [Micromonospora sp. NPDC048999]|uniref:adenylate kinase n=1 Tax=Micromonospora sp. NPDC048999 TaxID=3155391 RepID=UPI0033F5DEF8
MRPQRIALVGPVASGKSTLAAAIAAHTGLRHVDLDALFWAPNWTPVDTPDFHTAVRHALAAQAWVADGNYGGDVAESLLERADLAVWLDLPLRTCLPRLIRRSLRRAATGQELFAGNRETFRHLASRDSILWWGPAHHHRHRRRWAQRLHPLKAGGLPVLRLDQPAAVAPQLRAHGLLAPEEA